MKKFQKLICLLLMAALLLPACAPAQQAPTETPTETPTEPAPTEYTEPLQDGYNQVTFYWTYPGT